MRSLSGSVPVPVFVGYLVLSCRLTCSAGFGALLVVGGAAVGLAGGEGAPDVVVGSAVPVAGAGWAARARSGRFWCTRRGGGLRARVPKPASYSRGCELGLGVGRSQGRRRSVARGRARRSWVWQVMISHVQRSAACGSRSLGAVRRGPV